MLVAQLNPVVGDIKGNKALAETAHGEAKAKGVDLLVANDVTEAGAGFGTDTNRVSIVMPDGSVDHWPLMSKQAVAATMWDLIAEVRA